MSISKKKFINGLLIGFVLTAGIVAPLVAQAIKLDLSVPIPGFDSSVDVTETTLGDYVRALYVWFVGVAGIIAVVMTMWAGVRWITAAGNQSRIESAKTTMNGAVIGLVILLSSYLLLTWINPALVTLRIPALTKVDTIFAGTVFCDELDSRQFYAEAGTSYFCGTQYNVFGIDGRNTGQKCMGRYCVNGNETCAWTGQSSVSFDCQDPETACETIPNPQSQTDCNRGEDTSTSTGSTQVCRFADGKCQLKEVLNGCAKLADYYSMTASPATWVSCQTCVTATGDPATDKTAGTFLRPDQCQPTGNFVTGGQLKDTGGGCKEPGDLSGAVGVDAVCCRFTKDANKADPFGFDFETNDLICYMPF